MVAVAHDLQSEAVLVQAAQQGDGDAFAEGQAMPLDQALALALQEVTGG